MRARWVCVGVALVLATSSGCAWGQGSLVTAHSSCAAGVGEAGVGWPCPDGSAVYFNPAALALQPSVVAAGLTAVRSEGNFRYDSGDERVPQHNTTLVLPFGYLDYHINNRLAAGVGVFEPYAEEVSWPLTFEGRYVSYDSRMRHTYLQPTLAFAPVPRVALGIGLDAVFSRFDLQRRLDLSQSDLPDFTQSPGRPARTFADLGIPSGTDFADLALSTTGVGYTGHAALLVRPIDQLSIGVRYLHSVGIDLSGDANFSPVLTRLTLPAGNPLSAPGNPYNLPAGSAVSLDPVLAEQFLSGGALEDQTVKSRVKLPAQLAVGVAVTPISALRLLGDYQWTGWSIFDRARLDYSGAAPDTLLIFDYQDAKAYRAGAEYTGRAFTVRAGYSSNTAAARTFSVSPLLPEARRTRYAAGLGWSFRPKLHLDASYELISQADRQGRVRDRAANASQAELEALNVGVYTSTRHLLSATLSYRFGTTR